MPLALLDHAGGAAPTTLTAGITAADTSCSIASSTGWPTGGANGSFYITVDRGLSNEERIKPASRTGTTLSSLVRGVDGTTATSHAAGASVEVTFSAEEADDNNDHIYNTGRDDHTQYLNAARHAATTHTSGMLGTDSVGPTQIQANAVTSSELADNAVDTNAIQNLAVTAAKIASGTITTTQISGTAAITGAQLAAAAGIVGTQLANDTVTATQIAANAVNASELADNAVDSAAIAAGAVTAGKIAAGGVSATNQIADGIATLAKVASEASQDYTPTAASFASGATLTVGTGGTTYGHYFKIGRIVFGWAGFNMASDGNLPNPGVIQIPLPVAMRTAGSDGQRGFVAARARRGSDGFVVSGTGVITSGASVAVNIAAAGASAVWDATTPFNWGTPGDGTGVLDCIFVYEAAT